MKFSPEVCLITVCEPDTNEILEIGGTLPGDLFTDNFGNWLAGLIQTPGASLTTGVTNQLKNTAGSSFTTGTYNASGVNTTNFCFNGSISAGRTIGTQIQIGSSTTAAARNDFAIGTAFGTAPESGLFNTGTGAYSAGSGVITFSGSITAGNEAATINEALFAGLWVESQTVNTAVSFVLTHDATTATPFTNAKSITVQYSITD